MTDLQRIIEQHSRPIEPQPTNTAPRLSDLPGIRALLFDVYGTLLISGSGDVGVGSRAARAEALGQALEAMGLACRDDKAVIECWLTTITEHQDAARRQGVEFPEVDIVAVWASTLKSAAQRGWVESVPREFDCSRLAIEYEVRANPVWPMPGVQECLTKLRHHGMMCGIVSNAQFYTPKIVQTLIWIPARTMGVKRDLQFYSYQHGQAKPGRFLYERARTAVEKRGMDAENVLYVGNDMLNDVLPAQQTGFRTALFAGDARSLRLREDDSRVRGVTPDLVIRDLRDLCDCVCIRPNPRNTWSQ